MEGREINPLVPDAHYSEHQDKPFFLQIQRLEVDLKLDCRFLIFCTLGTNGLMEEGGQKKGEEILEDLC